MSFSSVLGPFSSDAQSDSHALLRLVLEAAGPVTSMEVACVCIRLRDIGLEWQESLVRMAVEAAFARGESLGFYELLRCPSPTACRLFNVSLHAYQPLEQYVHGAEETDVRGGMCGLAIDRLYAIDDALAQLLDLKDPRYRRIGFVDIMLIASMFQLSSEAVLFDDDHIHWYLWFSSLQEGIHSLSSMAPAIREIAGAGFRNRSAPPIFEARRCFAWNDDHKEWIIEGREPFVQWLCTEHPNAAARVLPYLMRTYVEWLDRGLNHCTGKQLWDADRNDWMHPARKVLVLQQTVAARGAGIAQVDVVVASILRHHTRWAARY